MLVTLLRSHFIKKFAYPSVRFFSVHSFQYRVFPIYSFHYINQSSLLILFIAGNSNTDILFLQKKKKLYFFHVISSSTLTKLGTLTDKYLSFCFLADLGVTFYDWLKLLQCEITRESCCDWTEQHSELPQAVTVILSGF